jgi:hypothetical protein
MGWPGRAPALPAIEAEKGRQDEEHAMSQTLNAAIAVVGIDIGKSSFHIVGHDERGAIVLRQKWSRGQVEARFANMPPCLIGMEACVGAHHLSRKLRALEARGKRVDDWSAGFEQRFGLCRVDFDTKAPHAQGRAHRSIASRSRETP